MNRANKNTKYIYNINLFDLAGKSILFSLDFYLYDFNQDKKI